MKRPPLEARNVRTGLVAIFLDMDLPAGIAVLWAGAVSILLIDVQEGVADKTRATRRGGRATRSIAGE